MRIEFQDKADRRPSGAGEWFMNCDEPESRPTAVQLETSNFQNPPEQHHSTDFACEL